MSHYFVSRSLLNFDCGVVWLILALSYLFMGILRTKSVGSVVRYLVGKLLSGLVLFDPLLSVFVGLRLVWVKNHWIVLAVTVFLLVFTFNLLDLGNTLIAHVRHVKLALLVWHWWHRLAFTSPIRSFFIYDFRTRHDAGIDKIDRFAQLVTSTSGVFNRLIL